MPLRHSPSKAAIGENIGTEEDAGKPPKQAIAIALNTARNAGASIPKPKLGPKRRATPFGTAGKPGHF